MRKLKNVLAVVMILLFVCVMRGGSGCKKQCV